MDAPLRILVVEDNPDLAANLIDFLAAQRHLVDAAGDGLSGLRLAERGHFDVILLDLMLPNLSGMDICRRLRQHGKATPILMLTARASLDEKIAGLEAGADDYLVKPFAMREVAARIQALARRSRPGMIGPVLCVGDLTLDTGSLSVRRGGQELSLPRIPLRLLEALMRAAPGVLAREELERTIWGDAPPDSDALRSHLHVLRTTIDKPFGQPMLHTARGLGWRLAPPGEGADGTAA
ncbi:MAG: response regulator transcription factor [Rhodocyclales bacterium]|nr:response regulator transcription factor [Rhodocyclales bacterium]